MTKESRIDQLERDLYSRTNPPPSHEEHTISQSEPEVPHQWKSTPPPQEPRNNAHPLAKKIFIFSILFFLVCAALASFIYFREINVVSTDNVGIVISHPLTIGGGDELSFDVTIKNENNTSLESASLKIEYPEGSRNPKDITEEQNRVTTELGLIAAGEAVKKNQSVVLFGEEKTKKPIKVTVDYRIAGSNATYEKTENFEVELSSAPVSMVVHSLKEVNSGQEIEFVVDIVSNSTKIIQNVMLKAEYPFGFSVISSEPKTYAENNVWRIGDLQPGIKRTVKIRGKIDGQDGEERNFRFSIGIQSIRNDRQIEPVFFSTLQTISVQKPFVGTNLVLNGSNAQVYITRSGGDIRADLTWENNLTTRVTDLKIEAKLGGNMLNRNTVSVDGGFYRSVDNTIVWDQTTNNSLREIAPGAQGRATFAFSVLTLDPSQYSTVKNPEVTITLNIAGKRAGEVGVPQEVLSQLTKTIRVATDLSISPRIVHSTGPFTNTGPIPPRAEQETTYTVIWAITNGSNDTRNVKVVASLPSYVKWLGAISPTDEKITFNPNGGVIEWNVGDVKAATGFNSSPKQVAFQISFTPSISQVGTTPVLVNDPVITGEDRYTSTVITQTRNDLSTKMSTDPRYKTGDEIITR